MLNVVVLDTLSEYGTGVCPMLETARANQELPIHMLSVFTNFLRFSKKTNIRLSEYQLLVASFHSVKPEHITFIQGVRRENEQLFIVFVLECPGDIKACVRPSLRTADVWFVPVNKQEVYGAIREIDDEWRRMAEREVDQIFTLKTGGEVFSVNLNTVCFFEARTKKMAVKTMGQEIEFYATFDQLNEKLPAWFIRCHRGFIINAKQITRVDFVDMKVLLRDKSAVPISRSYKDKLRAYLKEGEVSVWTT